MPEGVFTKSGQALDLDPASDTAHETDVNREFARAMAGPTGDEKAPPKRAPREPEPPSKDKPRVTATGKKPGPPPGKKPGKDSGPVVTHADRVQAVQGVVQLAAAGCVVIASRVPDPIPLKADAITLATNSEPLAEAIATTADQDERLAALIDKIAVAGPYAALITAVFGVGMQLGRNHGVKIPGTADPKELVAAAERASEVSAQAQQG